MRTARAFLSILALLTASCGFAGRALTRNLAVPNPPRAIDHPITAPERPDARIAVLWIGHATVLVQIDDAYVLTDPVFTRSVGELSPRLVAPGLDPANLPSLAAVVVSHEHFDHLSYESLSMIEHKTPILLVPPGTRSILPRYAFESRELETWQSWEAGGLRITAVPVRHVGGRWGLDQPWNPEGFTGWVFEYHGLSVYFGGDSAFTANDFRATRARFPDLALALLPICPLAPRDFMRHTHMDPAEALDAFALLGAKRMVPIHFDTFVNSDDQPGDCPRVLREEMKRRALGEDTVAILTQGEQRVIVPR
jgi:L-ascorbate metabolism protein UlaG (beta-lactamase superfamily)